MNENPYYEFEEISNQLKLITINSIDPSTEQFDDYCDFANELFLSEDKCAIIMDFSKAKFLSSEQRIKIGKLIKNNKANFQEKFAGIAYIYTSVIATMVMKGILLISPLPIPTKICKNKVEAVDWSTEQLKKNGWWLPG